MATSITNLPAYLMTPPVSAPAPPVETRHQELPFSELSWEDFERLCLRCAKEESDVEQARPYGTRGQDQAGIDLYARLASEEYRVYQCKNEKDFGAAKIRAAVTRFLNDEWADKAGEFVLCTRESLRPTRRAKELEKQIERLKKKGIELTPWDRDELNALLKTRPMIVDDFFGRSWVRAFCGEQAATELGRRLDAKQVKDFRQDLASFYKTVFRVHDRGVPASATSLGTSLDLWDRYIVPDIIESQVIRAHSPQEADESSGMTDGDDRRSGNGSPASETVLRDRTSQQRVSLDSWLARKPRSVVVADFGLGKSALLRFLALDLLGESPRSGQVAEQWGDRLPVWVPFPLWTRLLAQQDTSHTSLSDMLRHWLHSFDAGRLWPLVEQALEDDRLLLLVDGLDEWADETAANVASQRLEVFASQRNVPVVAAGRPAGYSRLAMGSDDWQVGQLAEFNPDQQRQLATQWFGFYLASSPESRSNDKGEAIGGLASMVNEFMTDVATPELADLAQVPLLLTLLIYLKLQNVTLPDSRFEAYEGIVGHLISVHPKSRQAAAGVSPTASLRPEEAKQALACLAYTIQRDHGEGHVSRKDAMAVVEGFLRDDDGLGFQPPEARRYAELAIDKEGASTGLLVSRSTETVAFFHRSFQEHLAAQHLSRLPFEEQLGVVRACCTDIHWYNVILALLRLTQRPEDVTKLIEAIEASPQNEIERYDIELLLTEAAAGDHNCPPVLMRRLADAAVERIETGAWMPHRKRLLQRLLPGLHSAQVGEGLRAKVQQWFPGRQERWGLYEAVATWQKSSDVDEALWRGLHDENARYQRDAAIAISQRNADDEASGNHMADLAIGALDHSTRSAALEALVRGWPDHKRLRMAFDAAHESESPCLRWAATFAAIQQGCQGDDDLQWLLGLDRYSADLDFGRTGETAELLATGWSGSIELRSLCIEACRKEHSWHKGDSRLDSHLACEVLLRGYEQDDEVAELLSQMISRSQSLGSMLLHIAEPFRLLSENFDGNSKLIEAIDKWIVEQQYHEPEVAYAALVGRTSVAKAKLLEHLGGTAPWWPARAMLEGWGMADPDVQDRLTAMATDPSPKASRVAHLFPQIITDKALCREKLIDLLADPDCCRPDFVLAGLAELGSLHGDAQVCELAMAHYRDEPEDLLSPIARPLLRHLADNPLVHDEVASRELARRTGDRAAVARAYGDDPEIRKTILQGLSPLPTPLREAIVSRLSAAPLNDEFANSLLQLYDLEMDPEVKVRASIGYHRRLARSLVDRSEAIHALSETIACYGMDFPERRQAALCGLIALDRLDVMKDAKERIGNDRTHCVEFIANGQPNVPFLAYVAESWAPLRQAFGDELPGRLSRDSGPASFWNAVGLVAASHSEIRQDLLAFVASQGAQAPPANILKFIARTRPSSQMLRDYCVASLRNDGPSEGSSDTGSVAAKILAEHFAGDSSVLADLTRGYSIGFLPDRIMLALARGWPASDEFTQSYKKLTQEGKRRVSWDLYFALVFGFREPARFIKELTDCIEGRGNVAPRRATPQILREITARLVSDNDAYGLLAKLSTESSSASVRLSSMRLMIASRGMASEQRQQLIAQLGQELSNASPSVGYDFVADQIRSVALSYLETLIDS